MKTKQYKDALSYFDTVLDEFKENYISKYSGQKGAYGVAKQALQDKIDPPKITHAFGMSAEEIAELKRGNEWQPIETAPKDGTTILAINNSTIKDEECGYRMYTNEPYTVSWGTHWIKDGAWMGNSCCDDVSNLDATHWIPIPNPPAESEANVAQQEDK